MHVLQRFRGEGGQSARFNADCSASAAVPSVLRQNCWFSSCNGLSRYTVTHRWRVDFYNALCSHGRCDVHHIPERRAELRSGRGSTGETYTEDGLREDQEYIMTVGYSFMVSYDDTACVPCIGYLYSPHVNQSGKNTAGCIRQYLPRAPEKHHIAMFRDGKHRSSNISSSFLFSVLKATLTLSVDLLRHDMFEPKPGDIRIVCCNI